MNNHLIEAYNSKVLLVHPGTQYAPYLAYELSSRRLLHRFWTGFAISENGFAERLTRLLPSILKSRMYNRIIRVPPRELRTLPIMDWASRSRCGSVNSREENLFARNRRFQELIPDRELLAAEVIIGFDTSSWLIARRARLLGRKFILDQSIGHPAAKERVFQGLRRRFPDWRTSAPMKSQAMLTVEREEHDLADAIVVPSEFVKQTLLIEGVESGKIHVIPFGTDLELFHPPTRRDGGLNGKPVVFLFVGGLTARKGLPVLLEAWQRLKDVNVELWLVGSGQIPAAESAHRSVTVKVLGPKGRQDVAALMRQADVLVFPSHFEGLAQVQIEALASGLPVIGTYESGAGSLIENGVNGVIVPTGDELTLAEVVGNLAINHELRRRMQCAALDRRQSLGWSTYGQRWAELVKFV